MDILGTSWFSIASGKMGWAAARQRVLSENVANADTPGYIGRDVVPFEEHMRRASGRDAETREVGSEWGGSLDGNRVTLEEQMALSGEASADYQLAARIYGKGHALIALAASSK